MKSHRLWLAAALVFVPMLGCAVAGLDARDHAAATLSWAMLRSAAQHPNPPVEVHPRPAMQAASANRPAQQQCGPGGCPAPQARSSSPSPVRRSAVPVERPRLLRRVFGRLFCRGCR